MVETYTPQPHRERASQKLGVGNYAVENVLPKWGSSILGTIGGWFVGGAIGGATGAKHGRRYGNIAGSLIGGFVLGFFMWRKQAASEMDSAAVAAKLPGALDIALTPDQVTKEVAHTKDLIAHEQRQNSKLKALLADGPKSPTEHAAAPEAATVASR